MTRPILSISSPSMARGIGSSDNLLHFFDNFNGSTGYIVNAKITLSGRSQMMRTKILVVGAIFSSFILTFGAQNAQDHKVLFEKAKYTMESLGDLEGAIKLFREIVQKFPKEREYAAKSQLYIGLCYMKAGVTEAQRAFQSVIDNYPEQSEAVKIAKEKLAQMTSGALVTVPKPTGLQVRKVWGPDAEVVGAVSLDGRFLAYSKDGAGDLYVRDLVAQTDRRMTEEATYKEPAQFASFSKWSKDGKKIGYSWYNKAGGLDLRIIDVATKSMKVLYYDQTKKIGDPMDWSPDGRFILAYLMDKENEYLSLIATEDGSVKDIQSGPRWATFLGQGRFSSDGKFVAFIRQGQGGRLDRDIFIFDIHARKIISSIIHPALDQHPFWSSDGKTIVFVSNRSGSFDLYAQPVAEGVIQGDPILIKSDLGDIHPLGMTSDGRLFYGSFMNRRDVVSARIDLASGEVLRRPEKITQSFEGRNDTPELSVDGRIVAFYSCRDRSAPGSTVQADTIVVRWLETGEEKSFPIRQRLDLFRPLRWSQDQKSIFFGSWDIATKKYLGFRLDLESGNIQSLFPGSPDSIYLFSSDGRFSYSSERDVSNGVRLFRIYRKDVASGEKTDLWTSSESASFLTLSPDDKQLYFLAGAKTSQSLKILSIEGGQPKTLWTENFPEEKGGGPFYHTGWTTDSRNVLVAKKGSEGKYHLWIVPCDGRKPLETGIAGNMIRFFRIHTETGLVVYSSGDFSASEIWVLENFLPKTEVKK